MRESTQPAGDQRPRVPPGRASKALWGAGVQGGMRVGVGWEIKTAAVGKAREPFSHVKAKRGHGQSTC